MMISGMWKQIIALVGMRSGRKFRMGDKVMDKSGSSQSYKTPTGL